MTTLSRQRLVRRQHGLITTRQLRQIGLTTAAIRHAVDTGGLHRVHRGVYAVGRPDLTRHGPWLAAVLACGEGALLSHGPAALLWGISESGDERPHVTVPGDNGRLAPAG
jgi:predicted transcriptional regulator of viral defense system